MTTGPAALRLPTPDQQRYDCRSCSRQRYSVPSSAGSATTDRLGSLEGGGWEKQRSGRLLGRLLVGKSRPGGLLGNRCVLHAGK